MASPHVLTFNFHEPYLCLLAKTGLRISVGMYEKPPYARPWQTKFRAIPKNITLVEEAQWRRDLDAGVFDVAIAHNEMNAANIFGAPVPCILVCHNRRTFLETTVSGDKEQGRQTYEKLLARLREKFTFVFISESKRADYRMDGDVIPPGIDVDEYGGYRGDKREVLRVGNAMRARNLMFDVDFQERVCDGFQNRVMGEDAAMPQARPSRSFDELLNAYRGMRCLLHVTREAYEDGYNLSTLEAMASGMPVVSLANATSPITDGVDGFASYDAGVLRGRIRELLDDHELARTIGAKGRETVAEKFPITKFVERWRDTIERAAERRVGRTSSQRAEFESGFPITKILLEYCQSPFSTGRYFEDALRNDNDVITTGIRIPDDMLRDWGFEGTPPERKPHSIPRALKDSFASAVARLPAEWKPSVYVWIDSGVADLADDLETLNVPRMCYMIDTHCALDTRLTIARRFNFTFLAQRTRLSDFVQAGIPNVAWMPLACSPELHAIGPMQRKYDVAFVGAVPDDPSDRRSRLLAAVKERFPNCWIGKAWPEDMARIYAQSKIVVNVSAGRDVNMRVFEALASGALLITDDADGLEELFADGEHLVVYRRDEDLIERVAYFLKHDSERERIASAGRALVLSEHTYRHRTRQMMLMVLESLGALGGISGESRYNKGGYYRSPRPELQAHVPLRAQRVLDCGCGGGEFGLALKHRGAKEVCGIEIVERAYTFAKQNLDHAILGSIEQLELPWDDEYFDCVVFGDVLEHLIEPVNALKKVARVLSRDGVIVMSIPNIRFWQQVLMHANGRWQYEDAGIMDRTHLRFFCAPDMHQMVVDAGLDVLTIQPLSMWPPKELPRDKNGCLRLGKVTLGPLDDTEYQDLLVYQYLVVAAKPGMDRLADAKFALQNHDHQAAYELAESATNVDGHERKRIMAKAMVRTGQLDEAEALYRDALAANPDEPETMAELGLLLVASGRGNDAEELLQAALARDPEHHRAISALGLIALARGDMPGAIDHFVRALDIEIDNAAIVARLLECAAATGRFDAAIPVARRFVEFFPGNLDIALRFAEALYTAGQTQEAVHRLDTLLLLQPGHSAAGALLARIRGSAS
ncbi:MAG: glycosyltransferase [Candidatus Hydrogenedentes bacterium]|nr:glycosyltransferase [Candidatus Hydrogenedentota bacterium]